MAEWEDRNGGSYYEVIPGFFAATMRATDRVHYWIEVGGQIGADPYSSNEAAKSAAETEARRVLMQGLRALGWPDEAAVERACDRWHRAVSAFVPDDDDYVAEIRSDMRAALTAAVEE